MEMIRTKLDALKKLAENLGVDPVKTARCVTNNDSLNLIAQHLGGETGARTNAEAIGHIAEVASAGGGEQNVEWVDDITMFALTKNTIKSITIPEGVTSLSESLFQESTSLQRVVLPDSLETILKNAFLMCTALTDVDLGNGVKSLGYMCFYGADLRKLTIPASVESTDMNWCGNNYNLSAVRILSNNISLNPASFTNCNALTDIYVPWAEGAVDGAPWGATNATIHYNSTV